MGDPKDSSSRPLGSGARTPAAPAGKSVPAPGPSSGGLAKDSPRGRIVHDSRGNAVWDWLKETGRIAIESTSRLLRKLEMPELKVEDKQDEELRLETDGNSGGGYDPYNQSAGGKHRDRGGASSRAPQVDPKRPSHPRGRR